MELVDYIVSLQPSKRYLIGISGIPGSGKSTLARYIMQEVNKKIPNFCQIFPVDGFHLYKKELSEMNDSDEAFRRRGAPFTFNPKKLCEKLVQIKDQDDFKVPSFDHHIGDPIEDDIEIKAPIILVEGIYIFLQDGIWKEIGDLLDEKWYIDIDIDESMDRVIKRHCSTGLTLEEAKMRVETNDRLNAVIIEKSKVNADRIIVGRDLFSSKEGK